MTTTINGQVYGYGTIGHTSVHHLFRGETRLGGPPLCDPDKVCGRVLVNADPDKVCGRCLKVLFGLDTTRPGTLPFDQRQKGAAEMKQTWEWLAWHNEQAAYYAWKCWLELSKPIGGQR